MRRLPHFAIRPALASLALVVACSQQAANSGENSASAASVTGSAPDGDSAAATASGGSLPSATNTTGGAGGESTADTTGSAGSVQGQPYAHVVAVQASGTPGSYTLSVSVESADIDCSQFADWWEVLSEQGALIYRRILTHSHTDENGTSDPDAPGNTFTRTGGPVPVGADEVVIVRAHMNVGGYNGRVMRGSAAAGFATADDIEVGFAADVEHDAPQPDGCLL